MRQRGLTLVEVLVALAITAVALLAGAQAMQSLMHGASRQEQVMLAQLCAENALVGVRLANRMPAMGSAESTCVQQGQSFHVYLHVAATANPSFHRVEAQVMQQARSILSLSTVIGRY